MAPRLSAMLSRVDTPYTGSDPPQAKPLAAETPMRTPVKEPGPAATASAVTSAAVLPQAFSRSSAMTINVWLWVRPVFW